MRYDGVKSLARGQWRGILLSFGFPEAGLQARHGPCPFCGGKDRYRWDNKDGNGSYFCSQCGPGSGIDLLMKFKGWDYRTAAREVEQLLGAEPLRPEVVKPAAPRQKTSTGFGSCSRVAVPSSRGTSSTATSRPEPSGLLTIRTACWLVTGVWCDRACGFRRWCRKSSTSTATRCRCSARGLEMAARRTSNRRAC